MPRKKSGVNQKECQALYSASSDFRDFLVDLETHKRDQNKVNTKRAREQAINTLCQVLKTKGGGTKIPERLLIDIVAGRTLDQIV